MYLSDSITAKDCMTSSVVSFTPDMDVLDALAILVAHRISGAPVLDEGGNIIGMLTERDCLETVVTAGYHGELSGGSVATYMSCNMVTVDVDDSLLDIARLFMTTKYRRFPVLERLRLVGIISRRDVIAAMLRLA